MYNHQWFPNTSAQSPFLILAIIQIAVSKMPRSATDATRFTSTTPHASKPPSAIKPEVSAKVKTPGPAGETPQEKVRRLRAAANRARDAKVSNFDRLIVSGRIWADRIHRVTALTLIGATGMASFLLISFGLTQN